MLETTIRSANMKYFPSLIPIKYDEKAAALNVHKILNRRENKTGLQPVSMSCGTGSLF